MPSTSGHKELAWEREENTLRVILIHGVTLSIYQHDSGIGEHL